jgi:hypothetical protein
MLNKFEDKEALLATNVKFNYELNKYIKGELPDNYIYDLGFPSDILLSVGIPDTKIEISARVLKERYDNLNEVKNLPMAIHYPVAVFKNFLNSDTVSIISELEDNNNRTFLAGFLVPEKDKKGSNILITPIKKPLKTMINLVEWIDKDKGRYFDKKRFISIVDRDYQPSPILSDHNQIKQDFELCKRKTLNFRNPQIVKGVYPDFSDVYLAPRRIYIDNNTYSLSPEIRNKLEETGRIFVKPVENNNLSFSIKKGNKKGSYYIVTFNQQTIKQETKRDIKQEIKVESNQPQQRKKGMKL